MTKNIIQSVGELKLVHVKENIVVSGNSLIHKVNAVQFVDAVVVHHESRVILLEDKHRTAGSRQSTRGATWAAL